MKKIAHILQIISMISVILLITSCVQEEQNPNIILIMADDLGWGDTGFNGNEFIQTPNLDQMAEAGAVMTRFYSASPVCSPTRASCLTGRNPYRMAIPNANSGHMPKSETTIAEVLRENGYATGHFGKWHLGTFTNEIKDANRGKAGNDSYISIPTDNGFDRFFSTESKVPTWDPRKKPKKFDIEKGESLRYGWLARSDEESVEYGTRYWTGLNEEAKVPMTGDDTEIIMNEAMEFIVENVENDQKFFAVIWTHTPHLPVVVDESSIKDYPNIPYEEQLYYGCITNLDSQMGRLWAQLKELDIKDNTIIFFCSDNGPEINTPGSAGSFRGRKRDLYEGGLRVPAFCIWPEKIEAGTSIDFPSFTSDYYPTILEILDIENPHSNTLDGTSLLSPLSGGEKDRSKAMGFRYPRKMSWVTQTHKLISNDDGKTFELYNLLEDSGETTNIIEEQAELAIEMRSALDTWLKGVQTDFDRIKEHE